MSTKQTDSSAGKMKNSVSFGARAVAVIGATAVIAWSLGFLVMPLIQGREDGMDWFTSICRAVGVYPKTTNKDDVPIGRESLVAWSPAVLSKITNADLKEGEKIATEICSSCHALNGMSADPATMPSLSGQPARALYKQLWDIKNGARINDAMQSLVADLNDAQISGVAAYYSKLKARHYDIRFEREYSAETLKLVNEGDSARALPACRSCHDTHGGPIEAPNLIGQYPSYIGGQLAAFAADTRRNDIFARMRSIAKKLTPTETSALARYYDGPR